MNPCYRHYDDETMSFDCSQDVGGSSNTIFPREEPGLAEHFPNGHRGLDRSCLVAGEGARSLV